MGTIAEKIGMAGASGVLGWAAGGAGFLLAATVLPRLLSRAPRLLITTLTSLGFWIALSSPSGATPRSTDHPVRPSDAPEAPWSPAEGPPPLPSAGARGSLAALISEKPQPHPAIHGGAGKTSGPLFPRLRKSPSVCSPEFDLAECMNRHPAGRGLKKPASPEDGKTRFDQGAPHIHPAPSVDHSSPFTSAEVDRRDQPGKKPPADGQRDEIDLALAQSRDYVVQRGDSLWGIAEDILGTDNKAKVARYWPAIHRLNRETIGRDPNYLIPGQVLHLPDPTKA